LPAPRLQTADLADAVIDATAAFELASVERGVMLRVTAGPGSSVRIDRDGFVNSHTGGAGLGLTIAARLLEHQGGTIQAANTPDRGAILTLGLPTAG
jgi:C4-dicarboxylate-specific signal transduction histidine kinase